MTNDELMAGLVKAKVAVDDLGPVLRAAWTLLRELDEQSYLPAPALTEDAIVAALKADPGMAGRVMVEVALDRSISERSRLIAAAKHSSEHPVRRAALQSLAVVLAAASYRG